MNIFYLSHDPTVAAQSLVDKHIVKMILESAQLLSTAHRVLDGNLTIVPTPNKNGKIINRKRWILNNCIVDDALPLATHVNHPCALWVRESPYHYDWLYLHMCALMDEYTFRYEKVHAYDGMVSFYLKICPLNLINSKYPKAEPPSCMDDKYKVFNPANFDGDTVVNYRNYYVHGKSHLHKWTRRNPPKWIYDWPHTIK